MSESLENDSDSSYYDSVWFGPYTIEEAKLDITHYRPKKIERRHSAVGKYEHYDSSSEVEKIISEFDEALNISGNSPENLTPLKVTEEGPINKSSEFLEKLSKAINEPVSESSYGTAFDQSNFAEQENNGQVLEDSVITISDDSSSKLDSSVSYIGMVAATSPLGTYIKEEFTSEVINDDFEQKDGSDSLIFIDGDEVHSFKLNDSEFLQETSQEDIYFNFDTFKLQETVPFLPSAQQKDLLFNQLSKISEKTEFATATDNDGLFDKNVANTTDSISEIIITQHSTSPKPELNQADDMCDFDDTLEEMNRFLEQGPEYVMPEKIQPKQDAINLLGEISGSLLNNSNQENKVLTPSTPLEKIINKAYSAEKIDKPALETVVRAKTESKSQFRYFESKIKPPSVSAKALFTRTTPKSKTEGIFKLPNKTVKKLPSPSKIVSPVGIYINHTRKYVPMIKVPHDKHPLKVDPKVYQPKPSSSKQNTHVALDMKIPPVIYKPAKSKCISGVQELNLPGSIRKLVSPQVVTKHERRFGKKVCDESIKRQLLESDLSINISQNVSSDVSVLSYNQPFDLKKF